MELKVLELICWITDIKTLIIIHKTFVSLKCCTITSYTSVSGTYDCRKSKIICYYDYVPLTENGENCYH